MIEETLKGHITVEDSDNIYISTTLNDFGIAVFFDYIDDETLTTEAAITDNFVETNYSIQDHIAIKPKIYRLRGCVGEIVYKGSNEWLNIINQKIANNAVLTKTVNALKPISAVSGIVSNYTQAAKNIVNQLESSYNRYKKLIDNFNNPNPLTNKRQQEVVAILNQILQQRIPVNLSGLKYEYNPFKEGQYQKQYYIQSVGSHQGNNDFISDIEVTIKEVRIATTQTSALDKNKYGAITASQVQKETEKYNGIANGKTTTAEKAAQQMKEIKAKPQESPWNCVKKFYNEQVAKWSNRNYYKVTN